jgi:hypothetical protein
VDIVKLDDNRCNRFQMLAGSMVVSFTVDPTLYAHGFTLFSCLVDEDSVRSILQPFFSQFVHPRRRPRTSRSTSALWARCAASHFHPTNVPGVITPTEKRLIGYLSLRDNEASESRAYCYPVALSVRFPFKLGNYLPCSDFILSGSLGETQV